MYGFKNIGEILNEVTELDIICISETWLTAEPTLPAILTDYDYISTSATREFRRGRAKGGLIILYKKHLHNINVIIKHPNWIFIKDKSNNLDFILGLVYIAPLIELDILNDLNLEISEIARSHPELPIIIGGDFNARMGDLNQLIEGSIPFGTIFTHDRFSLDTIVNKRGKILNEIMEENGMCNINGRTFNDSPAQYTYIGVNGSSVIDLVWGSLSALGFIMDFNVLNIVTSSDHFPTIVKMRPEIVKINNLRENKIKNSIKLKWKPDCALEYINSMNEQSIDIVNNKNIEKISNDIIETIVDVSMSLNMGIKIGQKKLPYNKPWFDKDCLNKKRDLSDKLKNCKISEFKDKELTDYKKAKAEYKKLCNIKKKSYSEALLNNLANTNSSKTFWGIINKFTPRNPQLNKIDKTAWYTFLQNSFPIRKLPALVTKINVVNHPYLDSEITISEVVDSINRCKNGKSPGTDGVSFEFFKNLPLNWLNYLVELFNEILNKEMIPGKWSETILTMIYKKGNSFDPNNYRPIALLNCITKIFTQILGERLKNWTTNNHLVPEFQSGFRKGRSCLDNIFILNSIIQIQINKPRSKLYTLFVDFSSAFPSICHEKLWEHLFKLELNSKCIRTLKNFYEKATVSIKVSDDTTDPVEVTRGLLQGEVTSPLLFSLFINDMENFFIDRGCRGLSISSTKEIAILAYADDLVLLADTPSEMNLKLKILKEYCDNKGLTVNLGKTKVVIFKKGNKKLKTAPKFMYGEETIEIVNSYEYLGIPFANTCTFMKAAEKITGTAKLASGSVNKIIDTTKSDCWKTIDTLFNSLVKSILIYALSIWGPRYVEMIERVQLGFFKHLLRLTPNTPNYALRIEIGKISLQLEIFKAAVEWINKILKMEESRYPRICFEKLRNIKESKGKYNWVSQIKEMFNKCNMGYIWEEPDLCSMVIDKDAIINTYKNYLMETDKKRLEECKSLQIFPYLSLVEGTQLYLKTRLPLFHKRLMAQLRLIGSFFPRIMNNKIKHSFRIEEKICPVCYQLVEEDLIHLLIKCPAYEKMRNTHITELNCYLNTAEIWRDLLSSGEAIKLRLILKAFSNILERRSKILYLT